MTFERENLKWLGGYVPGEQPRRAKAKLNTNENPFPPCAAVLRVLAGIDGEMLRRYPYPTAQAFHSEAVRHPAQQRTGFIDCSYRNLPLQLRSI